jgi:hypothetical protein
MTQEPLEIENQRNMYTLVFSCLGLIEWAIMEEYDWRTRIIDIHWEEFKRTLLRFFLVGWGYSSVVEHFLNMCKL